MFITFRGLENFTLMFHDSSSFPMTVSIVNSTHLNPAVDTEKLACLIIELLQVLSVPVEIRCDEQVGAQVYAEPGVSKYNIL